MMAARARVVLRVCCDACRVLETLAGARACVCWRVEVASPRYALSQMHMCPLHPAPLRGCLPPAHNPTTIPQNRQAGTPGAAGRLARGHGSPAAQEGAAGGSAAHGGAPACAACHGVLGAAHLLPAHGEGGAALAGAAAGVLGAAALAAGGSGARGWGPVVGVGWGWGDRGWWGEGAV